MRPLAVIGNVNVDLIMGPADPWPRAGTEIVVESAALRVGGSAGNTALAWQALGVPHQIAASVGEDRLGLWLRDLFGPYAARWPSAAINTVVSVGITHPNGERTFFTSRGHLDQFKWGGGDQMLDGERLRGGILLVCGTFLTPTLLADYHQIFDWAEAHDIDIALDTGWPLQGWTDDIRHTVIGWLPHCRHLLFNEIESAALTGIDDPQAASAALAAHLTTGVVVTKCGPAGATACTASGDCISHPAPSVVVIDTAGAGDVFNAAYLMTVAAGASLEDAVAAGIATASLAISTLPRQYKKAHPA